MASKLPGAPSRATCEAGHLLEIQHLLDQRETARVWLSARLRALSGPERIQALALCREAGIPATELAKLAGISRARLYQLLG